MYVRQVLNCFDSIMRTATAVRYNYYVQLVAVKRNWMCITNLNFARRGVEASHAHGSIKIKSVVS